MITVHVEKLYRYPRMAEHMMIAIPFKQGVLTDVSKVRMLDGDKSLPVQCKVTAKYPDNSVKYLLVRFMGDLPGNQGKEFTLDWQNNSAQPTLTESLELEETADGYQVSTGDFSFAVKHHADSLFEKVQQGDQCYENKRFAGPLMECRVGDTLAEASEMHFGSWRIAEAGSLCVILENSGIHKLSAETSSEGKEREIKVVTRLTAWAGKPWVEVSYRIVNTAKEVLDIGALGFYCKAENDSPFSSELGGVGHGSMMKTVSGNRDSGIIDDGSKIYRVKGTGNLAELEEMCPVEKVRTCTGYSNYKTDFTVGAEGENVVETVTADRVMMEANEHFSEVLYGTFFADRTDERGGICATVYQAQQNFPKAVKADKDGLAVMLVPRGDDRVIMQPGMSREQKFLLHFHDSKESLAELDNRSLIYQMPDRPVISPTVFKEAGVMPAIFPEKYSSKSEMALIRKGDGHCRVFGMLNWGDTVDAGYTNQGRGGGKPVFANNEYDFPHACAMMYARTGIRRFLDYLLVSASHWQDVDVCHYSDDPLWVGGQVEHTKGHVVGGKIVPSHEWVEGLLDYYHFTGEERALECAIGIGNNVLALLNTPMYQKAGEMNARETGWALRTLTALYLETGDEKWLEKAEWIVSNFKDWEEQYGYWLSPYTDNTLIRVGFMISVAVGSLMRYYRVRPNEELKAMMVRAIDDLVDNCRLDVGLFYYKELPSLNRLGNNTLLLEAMAIGYELTGDKKYLEAGLDTFNQSMGGGSGHGIGLRRHIDDAVIWPGESAKGFGQSFIPLATFDCALEKAGMR